MEKSKNILTQYGKQFENFESNIIDIIFQYKNNIEDTENDFWDFKNLNLSTYPIILWDKIFNLELYQIIHDEKINKKNKCFLIQKYLELKNIEIYDLINYIILYKKNDKFYWFNDNIYLPIIEFPDLKIIYNSLNTYYKDLNCFNIMIVYNLIREHSICGHCIISKMAALYPNNEMIQKLNESTLLDYNESNLLVINDIIQSL
jgi:hypothetical protein